MWAGHRSGDCHSRSASQSLRELMTKVHKAPLSPPLQALWQHKGLVLTALVTLVLLCLGVGFLSYDGSADTREKLELNALVQARLAKLESEGVTGGKGALNGDATIAKAAAEMAQARTHDIAADGIDDTVTAVVECGTSAGNLTIDVRAAWSPLGAARFLQLVDLGMFSDLPFTRVCPRYIAQFGRRHGFELPDTVAPIPDDPPLWGRRDMDFGYFFFAGSGRDSRLDEMVVALCDAKGCRQSGLGKALWETPLGTIRKQGFAALRAIEASGKPYPRLEMAGQHPKAAGPNPSKMLRDPEYLRREYPFLQYWRGCSVLRRDTHISRPLTVDRPDTAIAAKTAPEPGVKTHLRAAGAGAQPSFKVS